MKKGTSFRLSLTALKLLFKLSAMRGVSQAAILEMLIREDAAKHNISEED